jgi:hypothetical protein
MGAGGRNGPNAGLAKEPLTAQKFGHAKRQIDGLSRIETGITGGGVPQVELVLENVAEAAQTLGHVVTGELDMHAARPGTGGMMGVEESAELVQNVVEASRLASAVTGEGVPVHGVACPHHTMVGLAYRFEKRG